MLKGFLIDRTAEHGDDGVAESKVEHGENNACQNRQHDGVSHTALRFFCLVFSKTQAYKSAAAVTDHNGNGQGDDRKGKYHRISRIAIRSQIVGVGYKDLINDVIESAHEK